ncbi:hydantoinase/oxoprolinase family protein [Halococcus thailandensis]|uniref:N-methylhydantoinase A/acetone carboxylase, beta subunit n=1 Tax=Halococcus thailandensis JCM 13552 TaxID=1227457 RepID=M0NBK2_9EURY|nr:hydantoinase/oxoprolinase family protein [Halococcus thailandensis]EMA54469.1 N-methylhydantoinase A/acetone carboxylase, beta subunit [Halococcus thailandensis JCM 13552]
MASEERLAADGHDIRLGVDVGGTFTDVVLLDGDDLTTAKVPSTDDQSVGVIEGIEKACAEADIGPENVDSFDHGMTVSVNALLEEAGATTALVTTAGFRDVLEIGRQDRPALYDLDAEKPTPLVPRRRRYELDERATVDGIETPIDEDEVRALANDLDDDVESIAICLLHAYAHPDNERRVAELLRKECDAHVSVSHEVLAEFREYERTATTVADAYVTPAIDSYIGRLESRAEELGVPAPRVMQSNGGIADPTTVRENAVTTVLSGPAAGVVGAETTATGQADDLEGLITFDMGGTSSDVSLVRDGDVERTTDATIDGRPIGVPMVDLTTVGAGGGSVAWVDAGGALRVGPESAGAKPGPACYGRGGTTPTVTDANVVLGYIGGSSALGGELELDEEAAHDALAALADEADLDGPIEAARGVYRVANATMTRAIRSITVERGHDPRRFGLVAFGGAGPMHAIALADALDIERVVVPRACGVLSAYGLLAADEKHDAVRTHRTPLDDLDVDTVESAYDELAARVGADSSAPDATRIERAADCRYAGQSFELTIPVEEPIDSDALAERFQQAHETAYGYRMDDAVELVTLRTTATIEREPTTPTYVGDGEPRKDSRTAIFGDERHETPVYAREALATDHELTGPVILEGGESTVVVPPSWSGTISTDGTLVLEREVSR